MLQSSSVLAKLPKPLNNEESKIFTADVLAVTGSKKKKRSELAVAVDNEGVSLYDVRSPKLLTNYSVSPQTSFTCAPYSIRRKEAGHDPAQRLTYCSLVDPKPRIQCFFENLRDRRQLIGETNVFTYHIEDSTSPVIFIETVIEYKNNHEKLKVIVVHDDGRVRYLSEDLSQEFHPSKLSPESEDQQKNQMKVHYAATLDLEQARKGILKNREDIVAILLGGAGADGIDMSTINLLILITRSDSLRAGTDGRELDFRICSIGRSELVPKNQRINEKKLEEFITWTIPQPTEILGSAPKCIFHKTSGILYQYFANSIVTYDFSGPTPRIAESVNYDSKVNSCLRLSPTTIIITTSSAVTILDIKYRSIQATRSIGGVTSNKSESKRKNEAIQLLSCFSPSDTIVALRGRTLIMFQLKDSSEAQGTSRKRSNSGKLINSIGRGIKASSFNSGSGPSNQALLETLGKRILSENADLDWEATKSKLEMLVSINDAEGFDKVVASDLGLLFQENRNLSDNTVLPSRQMSRSAIHRLDQRALAYILNKIFTVSPEVAVGVDQALSSPTLNIRFFPTQTFQWLLKQKLFSSQQVEHALRNSNAIGSAVNLPPCAVIEALVAYDSSLWSLLSVLTHPTFMTPSEVTFCLRLALSGLRQQETVEEAKLITNGESYAVPDHDTALQLPNGESSSIRNLSKSQTKSTGGALSIMEECWSRLYRYHEIDIRKALKKELLQSDLLSLIDYLRMDLSRGGWLSRHGDHDNSFSSETSQEPGRIAITAKLLNCTLDALGVGSWMLSTLGSPNVIDQADKLTYMKAEISAALEGIEEAAYLRSMLHEVLLYSKTALKPLKPGRGLGGGSNGQQPPYMVKPVIVNLDDGEGSALPIGLKADDSIGLTKIGAGGEIQPRSMRDVGRLKSRKVGPYSFERIII